MTLPSPPTDEARTRRRFKDETMQRMYETCRRLNAEGKFEKEGPTFGSAHEAYLHGRSGKKWRRYQHNSPAYAAWRAGRDDAEDASK